MECISKIQKKVRSVAKEKGPEYVGATINSNRRYPWGAAEFEIKFFGRAHAYVNRRLKFPYLRLHL